MKKDQSTLLVAQHQERVVSGDVVNLGAKNQQEEKIKLGEKNEKERTK